MLCDFHRVKSIPIMALWSSGMIPPSGKTLVKCSKHGGGPDFDYRQSPFVFCLMGVLYIITTVIPARFIFVYYILLHRLL